MDIREWGIEWFTANSTASRKEIEENTACNYFQKRYMDSFGFIWFINALEEKFGVIFDNEQFEDREFATIDGLVKILRQVIKDEM